MTLYKTTFSTLLALSLAFPATVFASNSSGFDLQKVERDAQQTDSITRKNGVKFINTDGSETSLVKMIGTGTMGGELRAVLPSGSKTGLTKPLGLLVKKVANDESGIGLLVSFSDETFSNSLSSQVIRYDFAKSSDENQAKIRMTLQKMMGNLSPSLVQHNRTSFDKIVGLLLPEAKADSNPVLTVIDFTLGVFYVATAHTLTMLFWESKTTSKWQGVAIMLGAVALFSEGFGLMGHALFSK